MFSDIDDIVLSYVNGILEDLVEEENPEQNFDSEDFLEMILAYLPQLEGTDVSILILPSCLVSTLNSICTGNALKQELLAFFLCL